MQMPVLPAATLPWQGAGLGAAIETAPLLRQSRDDAAAADWLGDRQAWLKPLSGDLLFEQLSWQIKRYKYDSALLTLGEIRNRIAEATVRQIDANST